MLKVIKRIPDDVPDYEFEVAKFVNNANNSIRGDRVVRLHYISEAGNFDKISLKATGYGDIENPVRDLHYLFVLPPGGVISLQIVGPIENSWGRNREIHYGIF